MHFPKLANCINGGKKSAENGRSESGRSKSSASSSSRRPTNESTRSLRRQRTSTSPKAEEMERPCSSSLPSTGGEMQAVFQKFDSNGDGKISWSELGMLMASLGCPASDDELRLMVSVADSNCDDLIDFSEFVELNTFAVNDPRGLQDMKSAFGIFDFDGNGLISPDELMRVFNSLGERCSLEDCQNMIAGVDSDGNGYVSFDEFLIMMTASASSAY